MYCEGASGHKGRVQAYSQRAFKSFEPVGGPLSRYALCPNGSYKHNECNASTHTAQHIEKRLYGSLCVYVYVATLNKLNIDTLLKIDHKKIQSKISKYQIKAQFL